MGLKLLSVLESWRELLFLLTKLVVHHLCSRCLQFIICKTICEHPMRIKVTATTGVEAMALFPQFQIPFK